MANQLDIVNLALGYLNYETITGLDAPVPQAEAARTAWPMCRDAFLQEHPWSFTKREMAPPLREGEPTAWNYAYGLPDDFMVCYRVFQAYDRKAPGSLPFEIVLDALGQSRVLMCDYPVIWIEYGSNRPAVGLFSPLAVEALSYRLAFILCQTLKHDPNEQQVLYQTYMTVLKTAIAADAGGGRSYPPLGADRYTRSRRFGIIPAVARRYRQVRRRPEESR